jgi:putative ABC transport system ATP-binding protein
MKDKTLSNSAPVVKTEKLTKIYNPDTLPVHALRDVTLSIDKGEFTSIVGPSGSGKTTLLNMIGGLDKPTSGNVQVNGTDITGMTDNHLIKFRLWNIGFVFQHYNLIPVFTAGENVSVIMLLKNRDPRDIRQRTDQLLDDVGLGDRKHARPAQLSGGQQQRVAVARALASEPKFILADEPTANLDTRAAMNLLDIMVRLNREKNITFVFSTHDYRVTQRAQRVITMVDGAVARDTRYEP